MKTPLQDFRHKKVPHTPTTLKAIDDTETYLEKFDLSLLQTALSMLAMIFVHKHWNFTIFFSVSQGLSQEPLDQQVICTHLNSFFKVKGESRFVTYARFNQVHQRELTNNINFQNTIHSEYRYMWIL